MKSIQQIVENVMYQVTEISTKERINGIKGMARDIQASVNKAALEMLERALVGIDQQLYLDKERRKHWESVRKDDPKTIMTCVGELHFKRRYYRNKQTGEYGYLLDEWLGITNHQQIGEDVREDLVRSAVDISYQKSANRSAPKPVSKTSVGRYVADVAVRSAMQSNGIKRVCSELYVEADEDHVPLQNGKNVQVRLVYVHEGNVSDTMRAKLGHVRYLTWPIGGNTDDMWEAVATYIEEQYDTDKLQRIWLSGDGAGWIQKGAEWLVKCERLLDQYHLNKRFMSLTAQVPRLRAWGRKILQDGTKEQFHALYERAYEQANTESRQEQVVEDARYIFSHWDQIAAKRHPNAPGCSAEGHVSHVLSARLSSRPMGWSQRNLNQMAALRVMSANQIPIDYDRRGKKHQPAYSCAVSQRVLASATDGMRGKIASAMKNVRPPVIAAGKNTPTYMALQGLVGGYPVF